MRLPVPAAALALVAVVFQLSCKSDPVAPVVHPAKVYDLVVTWDTIFPRSPCPPPSSTFYCFPATSTNGTASMVGQLTLDDTLTSYDGRPDRAYAIQASLVMQGCTTAAASYGCTIAPPPKVIQYGGGIVEGEIARRPIPFTLVNNDNNRYTQMNFEASIVGDSLSGTVEWLLGAGTWYLGHFVARRRVTP